MLADYLVLGGVEIVNSARAEAYATLVTECGDLNSGCFDCPDVVDVINNGEPYQGVVADPAPWYDPAVPESARVFGIVGFEVTGLAEKVWPTPGTQTEAPTGVRRDIEWEAEVSVADECALSYAIGWLASALNDPACGGNGCGGQVACMLSCCPPDSDADVIRNLYGVRVIEGPTITETAYLGDQINATVTWTMRTDYPWIYREGQDYTVRPYNGDPVEVNLEEAYSSCTDPDPCATDPDCPTPRPPQAAPIFMDPCYPSQTFAAKQTLVSIPSGTLPSGLDTVLVVKAVTGDTPLRNLVVRVHNNRYDVPCNRLPGLNPCTACTDMVVTYVPPNGVLVIDGRTQSEMVTCGSGANAVEDVPTVYGTPYKPFVHPVWSCGGGTCLEILTDATVSPDTVITLTLQPRQEAG